MFLNKGLLFITALVLLLCVGQASAGPVGNQTDDTTPPGDLNGDEMVNFTDFLLFASMFGASQGDDRYDARADLDGDGAIGFGDFLVFAGAFGTSGSGGGSPDLIVTVPSVSDTTLTPGQMFTLNATVRNQGNGQAAETMLTYYSSTDATITTSDTEVGTGAIDSLNAGSTSGQSIDLNAPSSAGTYYYGACVASVSGESNADNNCSSGVRVTVSDAGEGGQGSGETSFDLDSNNNPQDILYANNRFYVLDRAGARVYGYGSDGQRDAAGDFRLNSSSPSGITFANDRFYVVDDGDDKAYGYGSDGQRDAAADFDLGISDPRGIAFANDRFYVVNDEDDKVYGYGSDGQRDAAADFDLG
ncbi:MAG: hypothetical protein OXN20_04685, partial [Gemmatimonadota bacterium]|nr:hypothetical protein [Gemmatimonadota bacterium]